MHLFKNKKISKLKYDLLTFEEDINKYEVRQKFINRNLNDTRYASKVILNGLDESSAYHGVDAIIIAASYLLGQSDGTKRSSFLKKISKKNRQLWKVISNNKYDEDVYKLPWASFINDLNDAISKIKYSHKVYTKANRAISNATIYSTRKIEGEDYIVEKYKNIYDNAISKKVIKKIKDDLKKYENDDDSKILMRKHYPKTFEKLVKIIEEYSGEKPNPFEGYRSFSILRN